MWSKIHKAREQSRAQSPPVDSATGQPILQTISGNPLPPKSLSKNLPALPSEAPDASDNSRVTSSIYSRDDSGVRFASATTHGYPEYSGDAGDTPDVSPPDTPVDIESAGARRFSEVSPVESDRHFFAEVAKMKASHIPVPQKDHRNNTLSVMASIQKSEDVPDGGSSSKPTPPKDARSASPIVGAVDSKGKEASKLLNAGKERLQKFSRTRDQKQQREAKQLPSQPREEWKGASGRVPLVPPIDTKVSTRNNKKPQAPVQSSRASNPNRHSYLGQKPSDTYMITTISAGSPPQDKTNKSSQFKFRSRTASPATRTSPEDPEGPVMKPIMKQNSGPASSEIKPDAPTNESTKTPAGVQVTAPMLEISKESDISDMFHGLNVAHEPRSRFSVSTYAPTEIATTPPGSSHADAPPVPPILENSPIMTRRRPIPSSAASIKSMKRKPVSSDPPPQPEIDMTKLSPEEQAQHRIDNLETRRRQLSLRKESIRTMLHELTEVIQPSSIAYDLATRDEVKKTVASLKTELDDIGKEDHEIGMKLVRLYKNLNNASQYEQSSLWVKRITS